MAAWLNGFLVAVIGIHLADAHRRIWARRHMDRWLQNNPPDGSNRS